MLLFHGKYFLSRQLSMAMRSAAEELIGCAVRGNAAGHEVMTRGQARVCALEASTWTISHDAA
jgi:hypothetical protein